MSIKRQNANMSARTCLRERRDDQFRRFGVIWQRRWVGGNDGLYVWTSDDGRLEAWCIGWRRDGGDVHAEYRATRDGELVGIAGRLRDVMDRAMLARGQRASEPMRVATG